jgi:predicted nucleotidyltransferase
MISGKDKEIIISYAKEYNVKEIYLFGSSLDNEKEANDIDLAVRGVSPVLFFDFYGKLLRNLSKPVGIVNLSKKSRFTELIEKRAVKIYG